MEEIVRLLIDLKRTISTMESCTGGGVANAITNIPDSSLVLKFSAVTYSNEFKIKMGVSSDIIDTYSVYSMETAMEMSRNISLFTLSNYGVGITGKLNRADKNNLHGDDSIVFISIYNKDTDEYFNDYIKVIYSTREENKEFVIKKVISMLKDLLRKSY